MYILLRSVLDRLVHKGDLRVYDSRGKVHRFGDGTGTTLTVRFKTPATERAVVADPQLALGEAYMRGDFIIEDGGRIYDFLALVFSNTMADPMPTWTRGFDALRYLTRRAAQFNPTGRAKRNVAHHYDIDGFIYDLFLDKDRQYSCAYFEPGSDDLEEAQVAKQRHLTAKLALRPGMRVLDIGSGWGGLGLYLAKSSGADVTGVTLSEEQLKVSRERAKAQHLDNIVRFRLQDYRRVSGPFDRIVSVGMFEHVGVNHYSTYFRKVRDLLGDDGVDYAIECSSAPAARQAAVRATRTWGTVCYVGEGGSVTLDVSPDMLRRQITLMGSWTFSKIGQADCARFIALHKLPLAKLITHRFKLDEAERAYQLFDQQTMGKGMILPS